MPINDFTRCAGNPEVALAELEWMGETDKLNTIFKLEVSNHNYQTIETRKPALIIEKQKYKKSLDTRFCMHGRKKAVM